MQCDGLTVQVRLAFTQFFLARYIVEKQTISVSYILSFENATALWNKVDGSFNLRCLGDGLLESGFRAGFRFSDFLPTCNTYIV